MNRKQNIWLDLMKLGHLCGCHQMADRSFFINGYQFPICARCTGVIIGYIFSLLYRETSIVINLISMGIMFIDWIVQYLKIKSSTNLRRLITGIIGGYGLMNVYVFLIIKISLISSINISWIIVIFAFLFILRYLIVISRKGEI